MDDEVKNSVSNSLDVAFQLKEPAKKIINENDMLNEKQKKVANFALDHEKLTKDVVNFAMEDGEEFGNNIHDFSEKEKNAVNYAKFAKENKEPINKLVDIALDNKDSIKDAVNECDGGIKKVTNIALDHEKLTKDVANLTLEQGENVATALDNFSKKENKNIMEYTKLGLSLYEPIHECQDVIFDNKEQVKEIIDDNVEDGALKEVMKFGLRHETLTRTTVEVVNFCASKMVNDGCSIF